MDESDTYSAGINDNNDEIARLMERIEQAYRIYKISEVYLNDVADDYGKLKIARLRMEFARHELVSLLNEASAKGIKWSDHEFFKNYFYPDS